MSEPIGRAGMDVAHVKHGEGGNRANRQPLLRESMRELDPAWTAKQAARNENVDPSRTVGNIAMVNDGQGGFCPCTSVEEVLDYGDAREARVRRKIDENSFTTTTMVGHLPKSMCEERSWVGGDGKRRTYWAAMDSAEMRRYFDALVAYVGGEVVRGGHAAIHGYDINGDEHTPHIQIVLDNFATDPKSKDPTKDLRVVAAQNWSSHREVRDEQNRQVSGPRKMSGYQAGLREHTMAAGFPVEADVDPVRSKRKQSKADFIELQVRQKGVADEAVSVRADYQAGRRDLEDMRRQVGEDARSVKAELAAAEKERAAATAEREEAVEIKRRAMSEGRRDGYVEGLRRADEEATRMMCLADADLAEAAQAAESARTARRAAEAAQQRVAELEEQFASELERSRREPSDFKEFLDMPMKDGKTMRAFYNRKMEPVRQKRARRTALLDERRREMRRDARSGPDR